MLGINRNTLRKKMRELRSVRLISKFMSIAMKIQRALICVSDKTGVLEFARALAALGVELLSTGGTAKLLRDAGLTVTEVGDYTGFPGNARRPREDPAPEGARRHPRRGAICPSMSPPCAKHGIPHIDLVCVNLYPFVATVAKPGCTLEDAIENIDIGGPTMVRSAAKNYRSRRHRHRPGRLRRAARRDEGQRRRADRRHPLRPGEEGLRPHRRIRRRDRQLPDRARTTTASARLSADSSTCSSPARRPALRREPAPDGGLLRRGRCRPPARIATARQLQGKELSYNNIADADAALECVKQFDAAPACVIVKHANPCGVAYGASLLDAYDRAYQTDPESAFGGIIAFNGELDGDDRRGHRRAPVRRSDHRARSQRRGRRQAVAAKKNVRLLECGAWPQEPSRQLDFKRVGGGLLVQDADVLLHGELQGRHQARPDRARKWTDLLFAWRVAKFVKSNAIVYAKTA